jgi:hypothetical protein
MMPDKLTEKDLTNAQRKTDDEKWHDEFGLVPFQRYFDFQGTYFNFEVSYKVKFKPEVTEKLAKK